MSQLISQFCEPFWQITVCLVVQLCLGLCDPLDGSPPGSSCPWDFSNKNTRMGCHFPPPGDLPNQGIKPATPVSSALWVGSLPTESSGKPKVLVAQLCPTLCNSREIFPTQGSNLGLLHCRQILYHLSHWGINSNWTQRGGLGNLWLIASWSEAE